MKTIELYYLPGDTVWYVRNNYVYSGRVIAVNIGASFQTCIISSDIHGGTQKVELGRDSTKNENRLFNSEKTAIGYIINEFRTKLKEIKQNEC